MGVRFSLLLRWLIFILLVILLTGCAAASQPSEGEVERDAVTQTNTAVVKSIEAQEAEAPQATQESPAVEETVQESFQDGEATNTESPGIVPSSFAPTTLPSATERAVTGDNEPIPQLTLPSTQPPAADTILPTTIAEARLVELEYPSTLRLGDSDIIRLALVPYENGYVVQTEFPDHTTITQTVQVKRPVGYELVAIARLDGVGFTLSPTGEQEQNIPAGEMVVWRWSLTPRSAGRQRLNITLALRWVPLPGTDGIMQQITAYSHSVEVRVISFLGLTSNQALLGGLISLAMGGSLSLVVLMGSGQRTRRALQAVVPNPALVIEPHPGLKLDPQERQLLSALFQRYARLTIEREFLSGYSGARTFLALPIRPDGRADAAAIVKLGESTSIEREYHNYDTFVKHTLPPVTARIQSPPVTVSSATRIASEKASQRVGSRAALQYTFIGTPGQSPQSLRLALLENPAPNLLNKLFETFGPNWWMQRRPYTFRLAVEYDRMLPTHLVIEPSNGRGKILDGTSGLAGAEFQVGEIVNLRGFRHLERRTDGNLSLLSESAPGTASLRVRWLSSFNPNGATGRVIATRQTLLHDFTTGMDLLGLPDPFVRLPLWLNETVQGSQSTIHGDLNLENILTGPGGFVWLIDFAQTRDGHPLYDFAHLEAEIVAHIIAPNLADPAEYLALISGQAAPDNPYIALRETICQIAMKCLLNQAQSREYELARLMAFLGALKFTNLDYHAKHLLYLTAANIASRL